jgi:hypothetical protein
MGMVNINGANVMVPIQPIGQEQIMANAMAQPMAPAMQQMPQMQQMAPPMAPAMQQMPQMQQMAPMGQMQNQVIYPDEVQVAPPPLMAPASQSMAQQQQGGMIQSQVPGSAPMIVVQTDQAAMAQLGLGMRQGRRARRNPYAGGMMGMGGMEAPMESAMPSYMPSGQSVTVRKLE